MVCNLVEKRCDKVVGFEPSRRASKKFITVCTCWSSSCGKAALATLGYQNFRISFEIESALHISPCGRTPWQARCCPGGLHKLASTQRAPDTQESAAGTPRNPTAPDMKRASWAENVKANSLLWRPQKDWASGSVPLKPRSRHQNLSNRATKSREKGSKQYVPTCSWAFSETSSSSPWGCNCRVTKQKYDSDWQCYQKLSKIATICNDYILAQTMEF